MRSVTFYTIITGFIVIVVSLGIIYWDPNSVPFVFIGAVQACLMLSLVWHNLSKNPELDILGVNIEPENDRETIVAKSAFTKPVRNSKRPVVEGKPTWKWRFLKRGRKVECKKAPSKLKISFDIVNRGGSGITVHEVRYKELDSKKGLEEIIPLFGEGNERKYLKEKERISESFRFPHHDSNLQKGNFRFIVTLFTYVKEKQFLLWVEVSEDKKIIKWWRMEPAPTISSIREWIGRKFE